MSFYKIARVEPLGYLHNRTWTKSASKTASVFMEEGILDIERALDVVADTYHISRDPDDYLLVPARAVSADRFNANRDGFAEDELLRFDPELGRRVYQSFDLKPHFINHQSGNNAVARGCVIDVHYNNVNDADDNVKQAIYQDAAKDVQTDNFVELLLAVDMTKDPALAKGYKSGVVKEFSMGADVSSTVCSVCGNEAFSEFQFCPCVRSKFSGKKYSLKDGRSVEAGEWCNGTRYAEISAVDDPADKTAEIQAGLLEIREKSMDKLSSRELQVIVQYMVRNAKSMPGPLVNMINQRLAS